MFRSDCTLVHTHVGGRPKIIYRDQAAAAQSTFRSQCEPRQGR